MSENDWICGDCGLPMSRNPHPHAGEPSVLTEVGYVWVCIPCTVGTMGRWATRARRAEQALSDLVDLKDGPRDSVYLRRKPKAWDAARAILGRGPGL